jgi:EpsD family peptidyl-prolyl cis-trans isomerase
MTKNDTTLRSTALAAAAACALLLLLAGCGNHKKGATQSIARVDGTELTMTELKYRLNRERVRPDREEEVAPKVLEQLIDEQLIVEKAEKTKLDLEPTAQQAIDAARRDVLARAYMEQAAQGVAAPSDAAVHGYYDANPFLFSQRRVYTLQEYLAKVPEDKIPALRAMVGAGRPPEEVEAWFKAQGAAFRGQQSTHPAEQIPLGSLKEIAGIFVGKGLVASAGNQVHVTYVTSSTDAPVSFDKARGAIAQFLTIEGRKKVTEGNVAALRTAARIEYAPQYAALAASGPALATLKDIESAPTPLSTASGTHVSLPAANEASGVQVTLPTTTTSGVQVNLPQSQGVRVSLPATPASSVQVRLPPAAPQDASKK